MIFPFVFHNGLEPWKFSQQFADLVDIPKGLEKHSPRFEFTLCDLPDISDDDLKTYRSHFELYKFLQYFKHGRRKDFVDYLQNDVVELKIRYFYRSWNDNFETNFSIEEAISRFFNCWAMEKKKEFSEKQ